MAWTHTSPVMCAKVGPLAQGCDVKCRDRDPRREGSPRVCRATSDSGQGPVSPCVQSPKGSPAREQLSLMLDPETIIPACARHTTWTQRASSQPGLPSPGRVPLP